MLFSNASSPSHTARPHRTFSALALGLGLALSPLAGAQKLPFNLDHAGNFKQMMHRGDTRGVLALDAVPQTPGHWGVGAAAGLTAELMMVDGRLWVSPGDAPNGEVRAPLLGEQAVLWVQAEVREWHETLVPRDMDQPAFEAFVQEQARALGLALDQPFVFRVNGAFPRLRWHVVTGDAPTAPRAHGMDGGHGAGAHANSQAGMKVFHTPGASGRLLGFYSGPALEGVVTHPGERFHLHYMDAGQRVSGHVDAYAVAAGATLRLSLR